MTFGAPPGVAGYPLPIDADADHDALVAAARDGSREAQDRLLRAHFDGIYAVCRRLTGNDADAADAAQEALLAIVRGLARFDGRSSFRTWAYRVTVNACFDELRRRRRRPWPVDDATAPEPAASGPGIDTTVADRLVLDAALAALPDEFRVAVVLRDVCNLDYAEIATALDIPPGTVRSRIARGRAALARDLTGNPAPPSERPTPQS